MEKILSIDGSFGEGGGAILRVALALSAIKRIPVKIFNIRKGRKPPGLKLQHLITLKNVAKLSNAYLKGDEIGSEEIEFYPAEISAKKLEIKIETAGSITLSLQGLLPVCFFAPGPIEIFFEGGGTDVPLSPTMDYYQFVFLKFLEKWGLKTEIKIEKRGYYPAGGAKVFAKTFPGKILPFNLIERGNFKKIFLFSSSSLLLKERKVAERQIQGAFEILGKLKIPFEKKVEYQESESPGSSFLILGEFENTILGKDSIGKIGKRAEEIGRESALRFLRYSKENDVIDEFLLDQILIYLALAQKEIKIFTPKLTPHSKTNIWLIEKFQLGKFKYENNFLTFSPKSF